MVPFGLVVHSVQRCYNASKAETIKWGRVLVATKNCIAEKETLSFRLLDQIQQLYGLFCARNGIEPEFRREQVEEQLDVIKGEMEFLTDVLTMSHKAIADEKRSNANAVRKAGKDEQK